MTGDFILRDAFMPLGAPLPHGSVLVFTLSAKSHLVDDTGVTDSIPTGPPLDRASTYVFPSRAAT